MKWRALFIAAALLAHVAQRFLVSSPLPAPAAVAEALPSTEVLPYLSFGYPSLTADYYWLRGLSHFGDKTMHAQNYPLLGPLIERVLTLDPYFATAYMFAGAALTIRGQDWRLAQTLLGRGLQFRPDDWRVPFSFGFNAYYFEHDYRRAAEALAQAAELPGAPQFVGPLATRLAAESNAPEVGLALIDSLLADEKDERVRAEYEERRLLLELELHLKWLNEAARRFRERSGHAPSAVDDLVGGGLLREIPPEPLGGRYFVNADGVVKSTNDDKRLRRAPSDKGATP